MIFAGRGARAGVNARAAELGDARFNPIAIDSAELESDSVACKQAVEKGATDFLVGVFVMTGGIVEGAEKFVASRLVRWAPADKLFDESENCFVIGDGEFVGMTGHVEISISV